MREVGAPMVEIRGLRKGYGGTEVLRGIDIVVGVSEVLCLIGRSGSGKTTLLRCINHLETPDAGVIKVAGRLVGFQDLGSELREESTRVIARARSGIGMVFQHFNLFPHMTVLENVAVGPREVRGLARDAAQALAREMLVRVGLGAMVRLYPSQISGGQQQRVAIARALAMEPEVMLFDEPTSALDPELTGEVLESMATLARGGMTMIVVTHEIGFARAVATHVAFMDEGRVVEVGPARAVIDSPQEERTRAFLAAVRH